MMRFFGVGFVLFLALPAVAREDDGPKVTTHVSTHYTLETNETSAFAKDALAALEAAWPQMESFFGAAPALKSGQRLRLCHLLSRTQWEAKMLADGVRPPLGAGGYYSPGNRTAYVFRQPTIYNTRQLLLHEAMHQFHYLACCNNTNPKDTWYVEGLVEHLSRHTWDGTTLRLGVVPIVSLADYPAKALALFAKPDFDLAGMIASTRTSSRPEQWALVRYLAASGEVTPKRWKRLRKLLDGGRSAGKVFKSAIRPPKKVLPKLRAWLATQQEPLVWVWNAWQGLAPGAVEGWAGVTSAAHVREDCTTVSCKIEPVDSTPWKAGLLLHYVDASDYTVALVSTGGHWTINQRAGNRWKVLKRGALTTPLPSPFRVRAARVGKAVTFSVQDTDVASVDLSPGKLGLALENCRVRFLDLAWTATPPR